MAVNFNGPGEQVGGDVNVTIRTFDDTESIYSDRSDDVEKSITDLLTRHKELTERANEIIEKNGICYDSVLSVESIIPGLLTRNMPVGGYSFEPSKTNLAVSMEAIHAGKVGLLAGAIILLCGLIYKMVKKIIDFIKGNGKKIEDTVQHIEEKAKAIKEIEERASEKEAKVKAELTNVDRRVEVANWVSQNNKVKELLIKLCRFYKMNTGIVIDPAKPVDAVMTLVGFKKEHKSNAQGSILAKKLPAIMFSDNLSGDFNNYVEYYSYLKNNIRSVNTELSKIRRNMVYALNGQVNPLTSYDYTMYLTPLSKLMDRRYSDVVKATADLQVKVKQDWLAHHNGPVQMGHVTNIIELVTETPLVKNFVALTNDKILEDEISGLLNGVNLDLNNADTPYQKAVDNLRTNPHCSEDEKLKRIRLAESFMGILKDNLAVIKVIAETNSIFYGKFIESLRSIDAIVSTYNAYYVHYNMFLDEYETKFN